MLTSFMTFARRLSSVGGYQNSFSLSDNELAIRGISRDALVRSYISGLGLR